MTEANAERTRRYLKAVEAMGTFESVGEFFRPDAVFHTFPNRIAPQGHVRTLAESRIAFEKGRALLKSQSYAVRRIVEAGDEVAVELEWRGVLAVGFGTVSAGTEIKADVAMFLTFRDGKIISQRNYDCYPPFEG